MEKKGDSRPDLSRKSSKLRQTSSNDFASVQGGTTALQLTNTTRQAWNTEVDRFRIFIRDEEASDSTIRAAWARLRQSYRKTFNAVVYPYGRNEDLEPFSFWAAENIEEDILERVIRIEFSSSLTTCPLSRLQIIAARSDLSIYSLILYFGNSFFIKSRVDDFRKRIHVFKRSKSDTWPFTEGYKRMLCTAAALKNRAPIDTTEIPSRGMPSLFTERILNLLAPANPEFERPTGKEKKSEVSNKKALSGIPLSKKVLVIPSQSVKENIVGGLSVVGDPCPQKTLLRESNDSLPKQRAGHSAANSQENAPRPLLCSNSLSQRRRSTPVCDSILPSIESDEFPSGAPSSAYGSKKSSTYGFANLTTPMSHDPAPDLQERRMSSSRKHTIKEECDQASEENPSKRIDAANSKADLLMQVNDWDDQTVILIMKQLAAIRPYDFLVADCVEVGAEQVFSQIGGRRQTLLVPFKLKTGQRILAVVTFIDVSVVSAAAKQVYIQYLYPACRKEYENEQISCIVVDILQILEKILPGYNLSPDAWHFQHDFSSSYHLADHNGGLMLCLATMSVVGGGPLNAPLARQTDWLLWRHILLSIFFPEDKSVQLRTTNYLKEKVERNVHQVQSMSPGHERFDGQKQVSQQVIMSPRTRLHQRGIHAQSLLQIAQEAGHILNKLRDHIDHARIAVKHSLDVAILQRDEQRSRLILKSEASSGGVSDEYQRNEWLKDHNAELEEIEASIKILRPKVKKARELQQCLKRGRGLISHYRRDIVDAIERGP
ncbi:hypothetical protein N0V93_003756 [Gnomoniopsis smithogilvyi]|uniref:Uncharacterized protein n=1 Tax=Gnomoniopsis smithogilvyi TaxID=1191159 RepID=A0A9W8Z114_9PEZI|nr:hypothetical protein N0V93_003756 [Gnomoniopsis smithogilvyi]